MARKEAVDKVRWARIREFRLDSYTSNRWSSFVREGVVDGVRRMSQDFSLTNTRVYDSGRKPGRRDVFEVEMDEDSRVQLIYIHK